MLLIGSRYLSVHFCRYTFVSAEISSSVTDRRILSLLRTGMRSLPLVIYVLIACLQTGSTIGSSLHGKWLKSRRNEQLFNSTAHFVASHSEMYADWYGSSSHGLASSYDGLHEFFPTDLKKAHIDFDPVGFCAVLDFMGLGKGMLLVGGVETARVTVQLASLLQAKHGSVSCSVSGSCEYSICTGRQKLSFIRSDDLSTERSYSLGRCESSSRKNRRLAGSSTLLCQPWAVSHLLSPFSVVMLNDNTPNRNGSQLRNAMDALIDLTDGRQRLFARTAAITSSTCGDGSFPDLTSEGVYRGRVHYVDMTSPTVAYATRHANTTGAEESMPAPASAAASTASREPSDMTKTMPEGAGRRLSSHSHPCLPYDTASSPLAAADFSILAAGLLYTDLVLSFKGLLFGDSPCCSAPTLDLSHKQVVSMEFGVVNHMLAHLVVMESRSFPALGPSNNWTSPNAYDTAVLSVSDLAYEGGFTEWYRTKDIITPLHNSTIRSYIVGIDQSSCTYLRSLNRPSFCFHYSPSYLRAFHVKGESQRLAIGLAKLIYPALFLKLGINVVFSEMDIFWRNDPIGSDLQAEKNLKYDIQVSAHVDFWPRFVTLPRELNIGIYYVRNTATSRSLFQDMLRYTCTHPHLMGSLLTWDQKLFDHFIRTDVPIDEEPPQMREHFHNWQSFVTSKESVLWRRLPGEMYTHNQGPLLRTFDNTYTFHISWGIDFPSKRLYCASTVGLIKPVFENEYKGVKCFN